MASGILWPLAIVVIWAAVFGITVLLVRLTMRGQQAIARDELEVELKMAQGAAQAGGDLGGASASSSRAPQRLGPPLPSA